MEALQYLANGLAQGSIYALMALGYTMVYGIIKLINFAHGEFYMLGAFLGYFLLKMGLPLLLVFPLAMVTVALVAVVTERLVYRPVRRSGRIAALMTALGVSLFFQYGGQGALGAAPRAFPQALEETVTYLPGGVAITKTQLVIMVSTLILMLALYWLVARTRVGKAMRAVSFHHEAAQLMGINTNRIISLTFFVGGALAAAAGVMVGMYTNTVEPMMGLIPGLKAFVAAVLGGIGIIPGAVLGGITLGIVENLAVGYWSSTYRDAIAFGALIVILLIRPEGILGKNQKEKV